jgi:hypothetical protein
MKKRKREKEKKNGKAERAAVALTMFGELQVERGREEK